MKQQILTVNEFKTHQRRKFAKAKGDAWEEAIGDYLRSLGFAVEVAKPVRTIMRIRGRSAWRNLKVDYFGCLDVMALHPDKPYFLGIQATTAIGELSRKKAALRRVGWNLAATRPQIWIPEISTIRDVVGGVIRLVRVVEPIGSPIAAWKESVYPLDRGVWMGALR